MKKTTSMNPVFEYILSQREGKSNKAPSYVRALELLDQVIQCGVTPFPAGEPIWQITSLDTLHKLYDYVLTEQKKGPASIFQGRMEKPSYWKGGFCSAAIKEMIQYASQLDHEQRFLDFINADRTGEEVSRYGQGLSLQDESFFLDGDQDLTEAEGKERLAEVYVRQNQSNFRQMLLKIYHGKCCLTGLDAPALLRASHISPWAKDKKNRLNPENGLLLSATYDAAFDQYLISFDQDYRMVIGSSLRDHCTSQAYRTLFLNREGQKINLPTHFLPSQKLLAKHRQNLA